MNNLPDLLVKGNTPPKKLINILLYAILFLCGWFWRDFPFLNVLNSIVESIPKLHLAIAILILFLSLIALSLWAYVQSQEIKNLKSEPEFIPRFNLNWKKKGNKIDPHPHCMCCTPAEPLLETSTHAKNEDCEYFQCLKSRTSSRDIGKGHFAQKDGKPISYKEAYSLITS